jgi:hypothetical protein
MSDPWLLVSAKINRKFWTTLCLVWMVSIDGAVVITIAVFVYMELCCFDL